MNRTEHGFDYEITANKDKYTVNFTSYERWMHKCETGEFYHPKAIDEYIGELRKTIEQRIEKDDSGTFDVIKYLKERRGAESQT